MIEKQIQPQLTIPRVTSSALRPKCLDLFCCAGGAGMGIDWISNLRKLSESIPPAYTKFIGEQVVSLHCW